MWRSRLMAAAGLVALMLLGGCGEADDPADSEAGTTSEIAESQSAGDAVKPKAPETTTSAAAPEAIPASEPSISAGDYEFTVTKAEFLDAFPTDIGGLVPRDFTSDNQVVLVEFQLLTGNSESFATEEILLGDAEGQKFTPFVVTSGGFTTTLADTTIVVSGAQYEPDPRSTHSWAFAVPAVVTGLQLVFPSGEVVDLEPLLP